MTTYPTQDEAIAVALGESARGDVVAIHSKTCAMVHDPDTGEVVTPCTCDPIVLTVGPEA